MNYEGIYLIREREFIRCNEDIYKIGKSQNVLDRVKSYPKDSNLHLLIFCKDSNNYEKEIIKILTERFKLASKYGAEYFEGSLDNILFEIEMFFKNKKCIFCITNNIVSHTMSVNFINNKNIIKTFYPKVKNDDENDENNENENDEMLTL